MSALITPTRRSIASRVADAIRLIYWAWRIYEAEKDLGKVNEDLLAAQIEGRDTREIHATIAAYEDAIDRWEDKIFKVEMS